jgi:hypothetical protein
VSSVLGRQTWSVVGVGYIRTTIHSFAEFVGATVMPLRRVSCQKREVLSSAESPFTLKEAVNVSNGEEVSGHGGFSPRTALSRDVTRSRISARRRAL